MKTAKRLNDEESRINRLIEEGLTRGDAQAYIEAKELKRRLELEPLLISALRSAERELKDFYEQVGPCDHASNICRCTIVEALESVRYAIKKSKSKKASANEN